MRAARKFVVAMATVCVVLVAGSPAGAHRGFGVRLAKLGDFDSPDYVTSAPGVHNVTYVVERAGKIIALRHGRRHTFLHIANRTTTDGERGLLSVAFDPHFRRNHLLYTYSTNLQGKIEIDEFHAALRGERA